MGLFNEIDETLSSHETFEKWLIFSHILHVVLEIKDLVCTVILEGVTPTLIWQFPWLMTVIFRGIIEILEGVNQEDEKVEELLLHLQGKLFPKKVLLTFCVILNFLRFLKLFF